jgi:hypothetical protein
MVERLSVLQKDILKQVAEEPGTIMRQVATELGKHVPAVHDSLQLLVENKMIIIRTLEKSVKKPIDLKDKGAWYAAWHGVDHRKMFANFPHLLTASSKEILQKVIDLKIDKQYIETFAELMVRNDLFDKDGNSILSPEKLGDARYKHYVTLFWLNLIFEIKEKSPDKLDAVLQFYKTLKVLPETTIKVLQVDLNTIG